MSSSSDLRRQPPTPGTLPPWPGEEPPALPALPQAESSVRPDAGEDTLRRHLGVVRRRWLWLANSVLLSLTAALCLTLLSTPQYEAQIGLFVAVGHGQGSVDSAYQGSLLSQQRVTSYAELVAGSAVAAEVVERLDLDRTAEELQSQISATVPPNTVLINVAVVDRNPELAGRIATEVADVLSDRVTGLEAPAAGQTSPIRVSVAEPAEVQAEPVSPDPLRNVGIALGIGLFVGVGTAFARESLDTTVSGTAQLSGVVGVSSLAVIPHDRDARKRPLIVDDEPYSRRSESFRKLRTNLQFINVDNPPRSILITSARAGEGKSSTACNLAVSLGFSGLRVCLVEADLRRPAASGYLGVQGGAGLTNVLVGTANIDEVIQPWQGGLVDVLAAGPIPPNPSELLATGAMRRIIRELEQRYDLVLVDSAPVLPVTDSVLLSTATSGSVIVVRSGRTRVDEVNSAAAQLRAVGTRVYGTVLIDNRRSGGGDGNGYDGYSGYQP
jgi:capsular exopolysaccharide synthesis family protein